MNKQLIHNYAPRLIAYPEISSSHRVVTKDWRKDNRSPLRYDYWPRSINLALYNSVSDGSRIDIFPDVDRANRDGFWKEYYNIVSSSLRYEKSKGPPIYPCTMYAQELVDGTYTALQYWIFYVYNDWKATHEGDWESVTVYLRDTTPIAVASSAHHGGYRLPWSMVRTSGTHPKIYVANGSHANYFRGGIAYKTNVKLFNTSFPVGELPFLGSFTDFTTTEADGITIQPEVKLLHDGGETESKLAETKIWGSVGSSFWARLLPSSLRKRFARGLWEAPSSPPCKERWHDPFNWLERCVDAPVPFWLRSIR